MQSDNFSYLDSVLTIGLTSELDADAWFRPLIEPSPENGLRHVSQVMVDKLQAIPLPRIRDRVGALSDENMTEVDKALILLLGFL